MGASLEVVKAVCTNRNVIASFVGLAGAGCSLYSSYLIGKEAKAFREKKKEGRLDEFRINMDNAKKIGTFFFAGVALGLVSKSVKLYSANQLINAQTAAINELTADLAASSALCKDMHSVNHNWMTLCNDITSVATLEMNKAHFDSYVANLEKIASKFDYTGSGIRFSGLDPYDLCQSRANDILSHIDVGGAV